MVEARQGVSELDLADAEQLGTERGSVFRNVIDFRSLSMNNFEVEVNCNSGGTSHTHTIVVESNTGVRGASPPTRVRLQYTCPNTKEALMAIIQPPVGAARPFNIAKVK